MSITHSVTRQHKDQSANAIVLTETVTNAYEYNFDQSVPIGTNTQYNVSFTQAKLQSVVLFSDQAVTIKTNSSSAPQDTINLVAGQTLVWTLQTDSIGKIPFAGNISAFFITNGSAAAANFKMRAILSN